MATDLDAILTAYCTAATIPIIDDAKEYEGSVPNEDIRPISRGLTYRLENIDRTAPGGGQYKQRGPFSGDIFTIKVYAMSDGTDNAETIMQAELADLINAVDTFDAAHLSTYDYSHLLLPNLKDIPVLGEKDYK